MNPRIRLCIACIFAFFACSGIDNFDIDRQAETTIQGAPILPDLPADLGFGELATFDLKQSAKFQNEDVSEDEIDSIRLKQLTLTITSPAEGVDFTFLDDVEFYVQSQNQPKVRLARGGPFSSGQTVVDLELDSVELKPYVLEDSMEITTEVTGRSPSEDTTVRADVTFDLDVNVGGLLCGD